MELREFVRATLVEIQGGVHDAITVAVKNGMKGAINPSWSKEGETDGRLIEKVQFDIAVTVAEKSASNAEGGIKVVGINVGGSAGGSSEKNHVSRIQFAIPIIPPVTRLTLTEPNQSLQPTALLSRG